MRRQRRNRSRGQSLLEFSLAVPILFMILLGTVDIGRYLADTTLVEGALRVGLRAAQNNDPAADVGTAIRNNAATFLTNNATTWGTEAAGGANDCNVQATPTADACGDPGGCGSSAPFWTNNPSATACFAVGYCTVVGDPPICADPASWTGWPNSSLTSSQRIVVQVGVKFTAWSPFPSVSGGTNLIVVREGYAASLS